MIVFDLGCDNDHRFEGWFSSSEDYERQQQEQLLSCPLCGSQAVQRLVTAARLNTSHAAPPADAPQHATGDAAPYANFDPAKVLKLISRIVENTEDVGRDFPEEVRRIHYKEAPERHIRGTASVTEVSALREEGIDVVSLPVLLHPATKSH